MSQLGYLAWYTNSAKIDPDYLLKELPEVVGFEEALYVSRSNGIAKDLDDPGWETKILGKEIAAPDLPSLLIPGTVLDIDADTAELGDRIERAVKQHIPVRIRGDFMPNRPYLSIGPHFWRDAADDGEKQVPYRAMVGCWGYSTPADGVEFRKMIVSLPAVMQEKARLEHVMGPLEIACYFHF